MRRKVGWWRCSPASDLNAKAIRLLAHIDVMEAKREDWTHDHFAHD